MNSSFLNVLPVVLLIAFFGLLAVGAIAAFVISIIQQRRYDNAALPSLDIEEEEEAPDASDLEQVEEYRFAVEDDALVLEDEETNQLMRNIRKLDGTADRVEPKRQGFSLFRKDKTTNKGKDGDLDANSQ